MNNMSLLLMVSAAFNFIGAPRSTKVRKPRAATRTTKVQLEEYFNTKLKEIDVILYSEYSKIKDGNNTLKFKLEKKDHDPERCKIDPLGYTFVVSIKKIVEDGDYNADNPNHNVKTYTLNGIGIKSSASGVNQLDLMMQGEVKFTLKTPKRYEIDRTQNDRNNTNMSRQESVLDNVFEVLNQILQKNVGKDLSSTGIIEELVAGLKTKDFT